MSNTAVSGNTLAAKALRHLQSRLPGGWRLTSATPDLVWSLRGPSGNRATIAVEAKASLSPLRAINAAARVARTRGPADAAIVVAPYIGALARERLRSAGLGWLDFTGNARIVLSRPGLFIETSGATSDPSPTRRPVRSLKGPKAARIVRALCDWKPPVGVRELARRTNSNAGYVTRVLDLLTEEAAIRRGPGGEVMDVEWRILLGRWTTDYGVMKSNRVTTWLAPRGLDTVGAKLRLLPRYAITGSAAVPPDASITVTKLAMAYVPDAERSAEIMGLRPTETGANVLLIEPYDVVVFERTGVRDGLTRVALSQCAADLMTGTGREPNEAEALMDWMRQNENAWRT